MSLASIMMPTGAYNKNDLANTGLNYWAVQPQLNLTYFNPSSGWDISAGTTYVISSEDKATNYQSGDIFHLDWAVGKQITPALELGMAGYLMQQVTKDSGSGATLGADEASVWALGPALNYGFVLNKVPLTLTAKWTHEFAATDTFRGNTVTTAISLKLSVSVRKHLESLESLVISCLRYDSREVLRCGRTRIAVVMTAASCAIPAT